METFLIYIAKSCGLLTLFFLSYQLLAKETFFKANRIFLLAGIFISFLFPLLTYTHVETIYIPQSSLQTTASPQSELVMEESFWNTTNILAIVYFAGLLFFSGRLIIKLLSVNKVLSTGLKRKLSNIHLIKSEDENTPFSFFNYLVYNQKNYSKTEFSAILQHEFAHIRQLHSVDIIIAEVASILLWFFPFIHFYKRQLSQNLEFLADTAAIQKTKNIKNYQYLLLNHHISKNELPLVSSFFKLSIKKRIVMLQKSKSKNSHALKLGIILPLLTAFFFMFNYQSEAQIMVVEDQQEKKVEHYEFPITKTTSDAEITSFQNTLKEKLGVDFKVKGIKRTNGNIVKFKSTYEVAGQTGNYKIENSNGIEPVHFFAHQEDGKITCGYNANTSEIDMLNSGKHLFVTAGNDDEKNMNIEIIEVVEDEKETTPKKKITFRKTIQNSKENPEILELVEDEKEIIEVIEVIEDTPREETKKEEKYIAIYTGDDDDDDKKIKTSVKRIILTDSVQVVDEFVDPENIKTIVIETKDGDKKTIEASNSGLVTPNGDMYVKIKKNSTIQNSEKPLFVIDEKKQPKDFDQNKIDPENIESINVLKGEPAIKKYGEEGKNGVIEVTTKK
ncbi:Signal transducer regulating beta-lactamase production, contains metallopeptidase domain [Pustulibacterium marinum]|uniref:Signal transducer regulating beta-lactamase production, contains metallopeptidase domain n=1 Tax=Pustulibacterium marinum TaxID=1224947 RepID=A0A1I7IUI8_9FLAO|nr:M56 family metallopeptidase [Pustulibacterium marinum]SFU76603.1 Signal transducer regulating beta-lactamase production, contains metallopeptidase domain [Pustulibacterium marinum]